MIEEASRIFVAGAGRSGLCIRAAGMRLMQMGKSTYIVGETITPSIQAGDLLVRFDAKWNTIPLESDAISSLEISVRQRGNAPTGFLAGLVVGGVLK